jgi:hypothetical protein
MRPLSSSAIVLFLSVSVLAIGQTSAAQNAPQSGGDFAPQASPGSKVPQGVILVKGAWSGASDSATPVPESGVLTGNVFRDDYFGMTYPLPSDWIEEYKGPPPSDSGRYVLLQLSPAETFKGPARGSILVTAQDMFFTPLPASNSLELIKYSTTHLQADHKIEMPPTQTTIAGRPFTFFAYWSPVAELHWYVVATEIRCHSVQIVVTSRDTKLLENLILSMDKMKLPAEAGPTTGMGGGDVPMCIKDYADNNLLARVDPVFTEHRFNPVPVRIIIDKEGRVKHIHFLSAFPDQEKLITDAVKQWRFKPYRKNGQPMEVETGLMFGRIQRPAQTAEAPTTE